MGWIYKGALGLLIALAVWLKLSSEPDPKVLQKGVELEAIYLPSYWSAQLLSFDRKLFFAKLLDAINITRRYFLWSTDQWYDLTRTSLRLDPHDLNALVIAAYQYMSGKSEKDFSNFYLIDGLMRTYFDTAKRDWKLMLLMGYWWQFRVGDLYGAETYAKAIYDNPEAAMVARETYPILISKLSQKRKALELYKVLYEHTKDKTQRRYLAQAIKELENE